ncbi:HlyD family efflux transporter periplasmic adaptor subunit [Gimesia panareensis]|uniref:Multidrug resistance protein MdtN n=1 Tax=Gimesia panareensis TaxID=2527978 RepID=A0A517Q8X9_9PLAN|nr:HlyD family efflux transporter periplasmic adaptor subunit [Gimesia panareensis]QDT28083.1 multidrug resistance protein MdtN [Gimesia panareensis]QDU50949.1 multidrug resistance protein MdtN [Gimesia panareensis]
MTSTQTPSQTRERVIRIAREIEEFAHSNVAPETFFREFLRRVVAGLGATAGAAWLIDDSGRLSIKSEVNLADTGFYEEPEAILKNQRLLSDVVSTAEARIFTAEGESDIHLPTDNLIVVAALTIRKKPVGVIEIFQRSNAPKQAHSGYLQFVEQMSGYASHYLTERDKANQTDASLEVWEEVDQFVQQLHRSLDLSEVAATVVNDGRQILNADRVSLAMQYGKKTVIEAINGQDKVNKRANTVRLLSKLSNKVLSMRENFIYSGSVDSIPPQIEEPLADYLQESGTRMIMIVPLFEPEKIVKHDDEALGRTSDKPRKLIGGLIIEQITDSQPRPHLESRAELLAGHIASGIANSRNYESIFLMPLWRFVGRTFAALRGKTLAKTLVVIALLVAAGVTLAMVPYDYRVNCDGRLMPTIQREVFTNWEGEVVAIHVESGQRVKKGDLLVEIRNEDLKAQAVDAENRLNELLLSKLAINADLQSDTSSKRPVADNINLRGKLNETITQIKGTKRQLQILRERLDKLNVKAPIDGVVTTFQVEQLLINRPVQRGELLMEIMDPNGPWQLELDVEEKRMGHILRAAEKKGDIELPVEFILATSNELTYEGEVTEISTRVNSAEEVGPIVETYATFDKEELPMLRIGAEVSAKIDCGERSLFYVLFGDVVETARRYFWF